MNAARDAAKSTRPSQPASATRATQRTREADERDLEPLAITPRFQLREALGQGGMGTVYRAYDAELGTDVAIKSLHGLDHESRSWLKAEFRALAGIVHPNLVQLYDLVVDDQRCFFTMELVRGRDLVKHVVKSPDPADALREVGRQLALALASLHQAGKLHRDVKPSNALVTDAGRVVLLDFGLVESLVASRTSRDGRVFGGTIEYMSPEQTWGAPLTPASDWYSFGVTLFETITGRLPIEGAPMDIAAAKRHQVNGRPSQFREGIPQDLDELIDRLVRPFPEDRPSEEEIVSILGGTTIEGIVSLPPSAAERSHAPFVGRVQELRALDEAWALAQTGKTVIVTVSGQSGIGKSELLRRYLESFGRRGPALVLTGRCHPHEALPFNAFDEIIDGVALALEREAPGSSATTDLPGVDALVRLFPTLGRVPALATLPSRPDEPLQETRRHAFGALRRLFGTMAPKRTPLVWIDDLQWADSDSGMLLGELLRAPGQPALLLVLSFRAEDRARIAALEAITRGPLAVPPDWIREIELSPLPEADALELVHKLAPGARPEQLTTLAREADGSPFFLCEAARFLKDQPAEAPASDIRVAELLEYRTRHLQAGARQLLELVAVAGSPLDHRTLLKAARLEVSEAVQFRVLEQLSVVRTAPGSLRMAEVYHHRIRDQILGALPEARRRAHHGALAGALLASPSPSLQRVIEHFEAAGDTASVKRYLIPAAREAFDALAFARAAELYRRALDLGDSERDPVELHTHLGHALGNAGRGREAGEAYEHAASLLDELTDPDGSRLLALQRRAAEQFLQSGHDQQGVEAFHAALAPQGEALPRTRNQAIRRALAVRAGTLLRSLDIRTRTEAETPRELLERFDTLWAVGMRISMINHAQANYLAARSLAVALDTREPGRLVRAMSHEASVLALVDLPWFQRRADRMLAVAEQLLSQSDSSYDRAISLGGRAAVEWLRGHWRRCATLDDEACEIIRRSSHGVSWEHALFEAWALSALAELGEFKELLSRCKLSLEEAQEREDRYRARNCSLGQSTLAWLAADRPEWALELAQRAIAWSPGDYTTQHYHYYLSVTQTLLYRGDGVGACQRSIREWPALEDNFFLSVACVRDELTQLRARTELAAAATLLRGDASSDDAPAPPAKLIAHARKNARRIERHGLDCGVAWATLLYAGADFLSGDTNGARARLEHAVTRFAANEMRAYENAARYCLGELVGGDEGAVLTRAALDWFASQEVVAPLRFIAMLAPGCSRDG